MKLLVILTLTVGTLFLPAPALAAPSTANSCQAQGNGIISGSGLPHTCADQSTVNTLLDIGFAVIGAVAILMVIIAGFRYIRAGTNETIVAESKRQLVHAIVGLLVVAFAATIVNFALGRVNI